MDSTFFLRQLDIADPSQFKDKPVTVIGAGGIGAATVVALAKTGFENITVYDFDTIGEQNLSNQLLPVRVGDQDTLSWKKTTTLFHLVHDLADITITPVHERYVDQPLGKTIISAVDSLDARQSIWAQVQGSKDTLFYLDGRMVITSMDLYAIDMMDEEDVKRGEYEPNGKEAHTSQVDSPNPVDFIGLHIKRGDAGTTEIYLCF